MQSEYFTRHSFISRIDTQYVCLPWELGYHSSLMIRTGNTVLDVVGETPMVKLHRVVKGLGWTVWAKLEFMNPGGSMKDRIALKMIEVAERTGKLKKGGTIVESTSGNTGAGLAIVAAVKGYRIICVMPDKMSAEKINYLKALGSRVIVTPTAVAPEDPRSYYSVAKRIADETPNSFYANQYYNEANPKAHFESTGPEIFDQCQGKIDAFICGVGTGGTISGTGLFLKSKLPNVKIVGVDPIGSILFDYFKRKIIVPAHTYKVEGIGEDFLPGALDFSIVDEMVQVTDKECFDMARRLTREEGIFSGGSCGAVLAGALKYLPTVKGEGKTAVLLFPDSGMRYLSKFYDDAWMQENMFMEEHVETVAHVLKRRHKVFTAQSTDCVGAVIKMVKNHRISQMPVLKNGSIVGMVTETDLLNDLIEGKHNMKTPIAEVQLDPMASIALQASISDLSDLLKRFNAVIVKDGGKIHGILARIDLIEYLAKKK